MAFRAMCSKWTSQILYICIYILHILTMINNLIILLLTYHECERVYATDTQFKESYNTKMNTCVLVTQIKNQNVTNTLEVSCVPLPSSSPSPAYR